MTNRTKWLIALSFSFLVAFALPAALAGEWLWFAGDWTAIVFVALTTGMWIAATAFVDVNRPRGPRDRTDGLILLALILAVPISVIDRLYGPASHLPPVLGFIGLFACAAAIMLGLSARIALGQAYQPRATVQTGSQLVSCGPYRWIRHPMYSAALLWSAGWPLIISSIIGAAVTLILIAPALARRIKLEEADLRREFGQEYASYCSQTWRIVPFLY
jgi:protein-S-isoprenylcysteine O-methyltransferase Ste14